MANFNLPSQGKQKGSRIWKLSVSATGAAMVPVQRTAKLLAVVSAERLGTGFANAQSKSISLSTRVIAGALSKLACLKYSAGSPSTFGSAAVRKSVRGTGT